MVFHGEKQARTAVYYPCGRYGTLHDGWSMGRHFPTTFFLLIAIAVLGIHNYDYEKGMINRKGTLLLIAEFKIDLVAVILLPYTDRILEYLFAYSIVLLLFMFARTFKFSSKFFAGLGNIGFVFFLEMPYAFITRFVSIHSTLVLTAVGFALAYLFAMILTKYGEWPLLKNKGNGTLVKQIG